jgi:hypothetical protein
MVASNVMEQTCCVLGSPIHCRNGRKLERYTRDEIVCLDAWNDYADARFLCIVSAAILFCTLLFSAECLVFLPRFPAWEIHLSPLSESTCYSSGDIHSHRRHRQLMRMHQQRLFRPHSKEVCRGAMFIQSQQFRPPIINQLFPPPD